MNDWIKEQFRKAADFLAVGRVLPKPSGMKITIFYTKHRKAKGEGK